MRPPCCCRHTACNRAWAWCGTHRSSKHVPARPCAAPSPADRSLRCSYAGQEVSYGTVRPGKVSGQSEQPAVTMRPSVHSSRPGAAPHYQVGCLAGQALMPCPHAGTFTTHPWRVKWASGQLLGDALSTSPGVVEVHGPGQLSFRRVSEEKDWQQPQWGQWRCRGDVCGAIPVWVRGHVTPRALAACSLGRWLHGKIAGAFFVGSGRVWAGGACWPAGLLACWLPTGACPRVLTQAYDCVCDQAISLASYTAARMLEHAPAAVMELMQHNGALLGVIGRDQVRSFGGGSRRRCDQQGMDALMPRAGGVHVQLQRVPHRCPPPTHPGHHRHPRPPLPEAQRGPRLGRHRARAGRHAARAHDHMRGGEPAHVWRHVGGGCDRMQPAPLLCAPASSPSPPSWPSFHLPAAVTARTAPLSCSPPPSLPASRRPCTPPCRRYYQESILVHEFGHAVMNLGLSKAEQQRIQQLYKAARASGQYNLGTTPRPVHVWHSRDVKWQGYSMPGVRQAHWRVVHPRMPTPW